MLEMQIMTISSVIETAVMHVVFTAGTLAFGYHVISSIVIREVRRARVEIRGDESQPNR